MVLGGDEFGRSQAGNNNAYCQDNEINWFDWEKIGNEGRALTDFLRKLTWYRREQPILHRVSFRDGLVISWLNPAGGEQTEEHWADAGANTIGLRPVTPFQRAIQRIGTMSSSSSTPMTASCCSCCLNAKEILGKLIIDTANIGTKSEGLPDAPLELPGRSLMLLI